MKILVVEDDTALLPMITYNLEKNTGAKKKKNVEKIFNLAATSSPFKSAEGLDSAYPNFFALSTYHL